MTKQQKIRQGVAEKLFEGLKENSYIIAPFEWKELTGVIRGLVLEITDRVLEYENSQDVVLKVNGELPKPKDPKYLMWQENEIRDAGYIATEPLVKEESDD